MTTPPMNSHTMNVDNATTILLARQVSAVDVLFALELVDVSGTALELKKLEWMHKYRIACRDPERVYYNDRLSSAAKDLSFRFCCSLTIQDIASSFRAASLIKDKDKDEHTARVLSSYEELLSDILRDRPPISYKEASAIRVQTHRRMRIEFMQHALGYTLYSSCGAVMDMLANVESSLKADVATSDSMGGNTSSCKSSSTLAKVSSEDLDERRARTH